ncbi:cell surface protein, putative [Trichomonas vaginalis G3]|uniref:Cell surface protein, putative n=1 Tax=Trichomonas vaginalis (strain ATCC PRA-98 / G3) TaxID=412133 RepID=A2FQP6_TRIV3|nr:leucine-rich repeats (6 copies)-containing protein [Trichomonas vaginalis G3]EAX92755.1 cell surface protein, putative [Trichomonas vaginalis G3]KAI5498751.1 leucine-rich repeats (6 copies)-containing protein [Trichomonas vaginalis G3]|eukprot:XP_001305685.1 cell surface protein [Trichomonas vaginalis G3]
MFAYECYSLRSLKTGGLIDIPAAAFYSCYKLTSIDFTSFTSIGVSAFQYSGIESITIPANCTIIKENAFDHSALSKITFEARITGIELTIMYCAFSNTLLSSISFPVEVEFGNDELDESHCLANCSKLESIHFEDDFYRIPAYFANLCTNLKSVVAKGVTTIKRDAFHLCINLETVTFDRVTYFGAYCYSYCSKLNMQFEETLDVDFYTNAFEFCESLSFSKVSSNWKLHGNEVFKGCSGLTALKIAAPLVESTFKGCKELKSVEILENITEIPSYCFKNCTKLTSFKYTNGLKSVDEEAFASTSLSGTFDFTDISIGDFAFESSEIEEVTIGREIYDYVFRNCTKLKTVYINSSQFNLRSFINTSSDIEFKLGSGAEDLKIEGNILVGYPEYIKPAKILTAVLPNYDEKSLTISKFTHISEYAFSLCKKLSEVIADTNISFYENNFAYSNVETVEIKDCGNLFIPDNTFTKAHSLKKVIISAKILGIGEEAFSDCYKLKTVELPSFVKEIRERAFFKCYYLKSIDISNVNLIHSEAFKY